MPGAPTVMMPLGRAVPKWGYSHSGIVSAPPLCSHVRLRCVCVP